MAGIQQQLSSLNLQEAPVIGAFNPAKGDIVLAQFSVDNSWNRAMVRKLIHLSINIKVPQFELLLVWCFRNSFVFFPSEQFEHFC